MVEPMFVFALLFFLLVLAGALCGIVALVRLGALKARLRAVERALHLRGPEPVRAERAPPDAQEAAVVPASGPAFPTAPPPEAPVVTPVGAPQPPPAPPAGPPGPCLEMRLGTRWLNWIGIVMVLLGIGFFLKYAYDNAWIGPRGRLALGTLFGAVALALGERFRRRDWRVLFTVLTGGGLAAFYLCIFFSFQVYHLTGQAVSMVLAIVVTALAVALAVGHNAPSIAVLALLGGFLSPILLSTGINRPYALFTYTVILDLTAMGAAYFRRWRALNLLCFVGTAILYQGWHHRFYAHDQMTPALLYVSLFYLMFLLIPLFHGWVRRLVETREGPALVVANAVFAFFCFYQVLFSQYRHALGYVVLGQALLVLLVFRLWARRVGRQSPTGVGLLMIALGLVTVAVPIHLKLYGIPVAWAMEGAVLVWLGIRFDLVLCRVSGAAVLFLAAGGLVHRLPLHQALFTPVFNVPFGSWTAVIAAAVLVGFLFQRHGRDHGALQTVPGAVVLILAFCLACALLTLEVSQYWTVNHRSGPFRTYLFSSLCFLWAVIPTVTTYGVCCNNQPGRWRVLPWLCFAFGTVVFLAGLEYYKLRSALPMAHAAFAPRLPLALALWWCAALWRRKGLDTAGGVHELVGHGLLALLVAFECARWGRYSHALSVEMARSLISAAWALHAFVLVWFGLAARNRARRYAGFVLFALAVGKTLLVDMSEVEKAYRIVSFVASGLLLVGAGYFYQRYSEVFLERVDGKGAP